MSDATHNVQVDALLLRTRQHCVLAYKKGNVAQYVGDAREFLNVAGVHNPYRAEHIHGYIARLIQKGLTEVSIRTKVARVRGGLFAACDWPWPTDAKRLHISLPQVEPNAPVMTGDAIEALIRVSGAWWRIERAALALSTVYGLRASELQAALQAGGDGTKVDIQTAKLGRRRVHKVPTGMENILRWDPWQFTVDQLYSMFQDLNKRASNVLVPRESWHSIRRALITALVEGGVHEPDIHRFMGWRMGSITYRYFRPDPAAVDARVFAAHPYIQLWRQMVK